MSEQIANLSYLAVKKESTKGTAVTPTTYLPFFTEALEMDAKLNDIAPIMGLKAARYDSIKGQREIKGTIAFLGDPNTAGYVLDMLLTQGSATGGSDPYTHPFTLSKTTNPKSYTIDILKGQVVFRYFGVEAENVSLDFTNNYLKLTATVSALGLLSSRTVASVGSGTILFTTDSDANATNGFVASDTIRVFLANGSVLDTTVTSVDNATQLTVGSNSGVAAGDIVCLRGATPSFTLTGDYFQFAKTEFRISDTAANALTAAHTPVEIGAKLQIMHKFSKPGVEHRSGSYNPTSLVRLAGDIDLSTKVFFDTPTQEARFFDTSTRAIVMRCFAGSTNQHELRVTMNKMVIAGKPVKVDMGNLLYDDIKWTIDYNSSDSQMFDVKVLNAIATI